MPQYILPVGICLFAFLSFHFVQNNGPSIDIGQLQEAAEIGNADSQVRLGVIYHYGYNVPKNEAKAVQEIDSQTERWTGSIFRFEWIAG